MSHHASDPEFGFPRGDARLDMTDLYAFTKPGDSERPPMLDAGPQGTLYPYGNTYAQTIGEQD